MNEKLCKDCRHHTIKSVHDVCTRTAKQAIDPVYGNEYFITETLKFCRKERFTPVKILGMSLSWGDKCGPEGKYFKR